MLTYDSTPEQGLPLVQASATTGLLDTKSQRLWFICLHTAACEFDYDKLQTLISPGPCGHAP